ncbi:site-specific integrase [Flavobacteriaceae bacterium]|jgi:integrase|nr:site-specific integrase [Flavobacteriaceae bacterium]
MPKSSLSYPKVCKHKDGRYYLNFNLNSKRYRLFNGKRINSSLAPNSYPPRLRRNKAMILAKEVYEYLLSNDYSFTKPLSSIELFDSLITSKLKEPLSKTYKKTLTKLVGCLRNELVNKGGISKQFLINIPSKYTNNTSYNTTRRHLNVLVNYLHEHGFDVQKPTLKTRKQNETLHKPINDVKGLLDEVCCFNKNLHLCCLLTYCCLLRPHQEIRRLKWSDFSEGLKTISLSGGKVKSKRNRVVPVPIYIRELLVKGQPHHNIFTDTIRPLNEDYFKTLWSRFKRVSKLLEQDQTLYSFRHSGAIEIFKRTGSITKLQKAMGHSSINVSLTYLRGLEIAELKEEDMPMV